MSQKTAGQIWGIHTGEDEAFLSFYARLHKAPTAEEIASIKALRENSAAVAQAATYAGKKRIPYATINKSARTRYAELLLPVDAMQPYDDSAQDYTKAQGLGVLRISGYITKDSYWYLDNDGTEAILADLLQMGADPRVTGVALVIDSGGGEIRGVEELSNTIRGFYAKYKKRVYAFIDGMAASAAYWIASAADRIVLVGNSSSVGSIGTMATIVSYSEMDKRMGITIRNIYATLSTEKNAPTEEAQRGNDAPMRALLDNYNLAFVGDVIKGRYRNTYKAENFTPDNVPVQFKGAMFFGREAVRIGLADSVVGTKEEAFNDFMRTALNGTAAGRNDSDAQAAAQPSAGCDKDEYEDDDSEEMQNDDPMQKAKDMLKKAGAGMDKKEKANEASIAQAEPLPVRPLRSFRITTQ